MTAYDCFNGDADGICALIQLRLAIPVDSVLVTGIKRDIKLLARVEAEAGDKVNVLDVSMAKNAEPLAKVLASGAEVFYADHHQAGDIPDVANLQAHINTSPNICTALIINAHLKGAYKDWAIVAAFGDNITAVAEQMCAKAEYTAEQTKQLRQLGICMNYNGYGASLDDLFYDPADLYRIAVQYQSPFDFIANEPEVITTLAQGYEQDMAKALAAEVLHESSAVAMMLLPDEKWARRVSGVVGNELANRFPDRAHGILTDKAAGFQVSIRAPKNKLTGADDIAASFGGGGRKGAAGIDMLKSEQVGVLFDKLNEAYG